MVKTKKPKNNLNVGGINYRPADAVLAHFEQAERLFAESDFHHAKELYLEIRSADKHFAPALRQLAMCELQLNNFASAIKLFLKYIKSTPNDQLAQAKLGQAYLLDGKPAKAKPHILRAIRIAPTADLYFLAAAVSEALAEPLKALEHYEQGLVLDPQRLSAKLAIGLISKNMSNYGRAINTFKEILQAQPHHANALSNLGTVYQTLGLFEEAVSSYQAAYVVNPSADVAYNKGLSHQQLLQSDDSLSAFKLALSIAPEHLAAKTQLAETYSSQGLFLESQQTLEEIISVDHDNFQAWYLKTQSEKFVAENSPIETKLVAMKNASERPEEKCLANFALGKIYDDTNRYELAFQHFDVANKHKFKLVKELAHSQLEDLEPNTSTDTAFQHALADIQDDPSLLSPIFIIGMPRSGTTLLERTVASDASIHPCGELDYFGPALFRRAAGLGEFDDKPNDGEITEAELTILRTGYLNRVSSISQEKNNFIDKTPDNFRYLSLIIKLFPGARIIHSRRHPLDTCLSIYFQLFEGLPYSFDLDTIATYYSKYRKCIQLFPRQNMTQWLDIDYEAVVQDPASTVKNLSEFLNCNVLPVESLKASSQSTISTMSKWQARQSLYLQSINRWKNYESKIGVLVNKLTEFLPD